MALPDGSSVSSLATFSKSSPFFRRSDDRLDLVLGRLARLLVAWRGADQDVAGVHLLHLAHLLDGFVIDLVHGLVGERRLADRLQHLFHQQLVARERDPALERVAVGHLLGFGRLRHQDHVGDELDQVVLLGVRRHRRNLAGLFLGDGEVALVDLGAVDLGDERILVLGCERAGGREQQRQGGGKEAGRAGVMGNRHGAILGAVLEKGWSAAGADGGGLVTQQPWLCNGRGP